MMPPTRIEQLNNFQDAVQSPDGLDRLRALQVIEQALPSSQGLMGMPQVQAPMPVVNRFIGGGVSNEEQEARRLDPYMVRTSEGDDVKVFARDQEGILNRALQGGVLEGQRYTPTGGSPTTAVLPESTQTQNTLMGDGPPDQALGQLVNQLSTPMQGQFKNKAEAMAHAKANQGRGLVNVYQLSDGSWDYQRTGRPTSYAIGAEPNSPFAMAGGGQIDPSQTAQGLASFGRYGDNILVHMNPEELSGLASLGEITYNPVTGLPEAFGLRSIFRAVRKLAPVALAIAAPYALGAALGTGVGGLSALQFGLASGVGSFAGNKIAGAKTSDALKAGLFSGAIGGIGQGVSTGNWLESAGAKAADIAATATPTVGQDLIGKSVTTNTLQPASQFGTATPSNIASGSARVGLGGTVGRAPIQSSGNLIERISNSPLVTDTGQTLKDIGSQIYEDYSTKGGVAKLVGMDLMTPDWEAQYAAEAAAKEQQLQDAGYTIDTGFGGQTVIRDSSGVQMPRTLTVQQILDRALGKTPRTKLVADYKYAPSDAKEGGLVSLKHGGEFSGMVPGEGHGMEDNVYMPIVEKGHGSQVGTLAVSPSEYVVDSYTMAALGNGNADAGAKVMDRVVKSVRKKAYGDTEQPNEISGLQALKPMMERV